MKENLLLLSLEEQMLYKYMTSLLKNMSINKLDDIVIRHIGLVLYIMPFGNPVPSLYVFVFFTISALNLHQLSGPVVQWANWKFVIFFRGQMKYECK